MSKTRRLFGIFGVICIASIVGIIYMFCNLGSDKTVIESFNLVQHEDGDWNEATIENLEAKVRYYLGDDREAYFIYRDGEVSDVDITTNEKVPVGLMEELSAGISVDVDEYLDNLDYVESKTNGVQLGENSIIYYEDDGWRMYKLLKVEEDDNGERLVKMGCLDLGDIERVLEGYEEDDSEGLSKEEAGISPPSRIANHDSLIKEEGNKIYLFHGGNLYVTNREELLEIKTYTDIDIARGNANNCGLKPVFSWPQEWERFVCGEFIFDKEQYLVAVGSSSDSDESFTVHVCVVDANTGEVIASEEQYIEIDEFTVNRNNNMKSEYEKERPLEMSVADYIKYNMITREYSLVTASQICGYQNMIKIDYEYDKDGKILGLKLSEINVTTDNREYISTMIDTCEGEDGTLYVCYLEGIRGRERKYTDYWARRMLVDGKAWSFDKNRDFGWYFYLHESDYKVEYWFNGVGIRAFKDGEMVYWGYFESDISKLFAESIDEVIDCGEPYASNGANLLNIELDVVN